ncbi:MBL fold metallo-hydrolase [Thermosediminibacter litoriperuensis]|uniref:Glyoxylase-like metal-dependent hydrolase (Beta-lactamase superfamily II) n=1 Tax=Thermosediminibacter litoriperuensis TaxID=291989 RepID=A0A5S5AKM2_9FIRM|nr:MBL fold metallo-hydrolase [Thermosediminibacter litoriperuensis]TYP50371.1 glyoxylase-like metal-dependent hydrolase (beta-lactamase superfamily II) [Thermosediminibacter litoriperuensis]
MFLKRLQVGPLASNCYILGDEHSKKAAIIDPGGDPEIILEAVNKEGFMVEFLILTHGHFDHIGAVREVKKSTGARIAIHEKDAKMLLSAEENLSSYMGCGFTQPAAEVELKGDEQLRVGDIMLEIIWTPGHTPGSICIKTEDVLFTGDTLLAGSVGRTDFPGGSYRELLNSIKTKLLTFDDDVRVLPGHGPESTIGSEKATNPFLR